MSQSSYDFLNPDSNSVVDLESRRQSFDVQSITQIPEIVMYSAQYKCILEPDFVKCGSALILSKPSFLSLSNVLLTSAAVLTLYVVANTLKKGYKFYLSSGKQYQEVFLDSSNFNEKIFTINKNVPKYITDLWKDLNLTGLYNEKHKNDNTSNIYNLEEDIKVTQTIKDKFEISHYEKFNKAVESENKIKIENNEFKDLLSQLRPVNISMLQKDDVALQVLEDFKNSKPSIKKNNLKLKNVSYMENNSFYDGQNFSYMENNIHINQNITNVFNFVIQNNTKSEEPSVESSKQPLNAFEKIEPIIEQEKPIIDSKSTDFLFFNNHLNKYFELGYKKEVLMASALLFLTLPKIKNSEQETLFAGARLLSAAHLYLSDVSIVDLLPEIIQDVFTLEHAMIGYL